MVFKKGHIMSKEVRKKIGDFHRGRKRSQETKEKMRIKATGRLHSDETKKKLSQKHKGKKLSREHKEKISESNMGKKHGFTKGQVSINYIDGRSKLRSPGIYGDDWSKIRMLIYARDGFSCQHCGITMSETKRAHHVHHKIPFMESFDNSLSNLITLCPPCHRTEEAKIARQRRGILA